MTANITLIGNAIDKPAEYGKIKVLRLATSNSKDDKNPAYWDIKILSPWLCDAASSIEKGARLIVIANIKGSTYQTKDGQTRHGTEIIASTIGRVLQTEANPITSGMMPAGSSPFIYPTDAPAF